MWVGFNHRITGCLPFQALQDLGAIHWQLNQLRLVTSPPLYMKNQLSHEKYPGWLAYIGDYTTQLYRDYFINDYKDPY